MFGVLMSFLFVAIGLGTAMDAWGFRRSGPATRSRSVARGRQRVKRRGT